MSLVNADHYDALHRRRIGDHVHMGSIKGVDEVSRCRCMCFGRHLLKIIAHDVDGLFS